MGTKFQTSAIVVLLAQSVSTFAQRPTVDPTLVDIEVAGPFRALVYSVCSPEHCWNELFVEVLDLEILPRSVTCEVRIDEVAYGHAISSAEWKWPVEGQAGTAILELDVESSHGGFEPYSANFTVREDCRYEPGPPRPAA